jgi:hypothetical protein
VHQADVVGRGAPAVTRPHQAQLQFVIRRNCPATRIRRSLLFPDTCLEHQLKAWRRHYLNARITSLEIHIVASLRR